MDRLENVATPFAAGTVVLPVRARRSCYLPIATVMLAVEAVTVLLNASCTVTCTAGAIATPAVALVGCTVNASLVAAAGLMLNPDEVAPVRPAEVAPSV